MFCMSAVGYLQIIYVNNTINDQCQTVCKGYQQKLLVIPYCIYRFIQTNSKYLDQSTHVEDQMLFANFKNI